MGTAGHEITVINTGARPCALLGDEVVMVFTDSTGKTAVLPTRSTGDSAAASRILGRGRQAQATVLTVNGYGGYDPSSPECAHPAVYRNLSLRFSGGGLLAVEGLALDVKCGDIRVSRWSTA
jgi:Domain of unknown function (DUF4232)